MADAEIDVLIEPLNSQDMPVILLTVSRWLNLSFTRLARKISAYSLIFTTVRKLMATWRKISNAILPLLNIFKSLLFLIAMNQEPGVK
jgi:cellulose synthase/poly-beta-1,6-N-acetylglucosamine synthase-like glycosyltransferase